MKQIRAVVRDYMAEKVVRALHELPHFPGLTMTDVHGQSRGRGPDHCYQPSEKLADARYRLVEILCAQEAVAVIAATIRNSAHTGLPGDGVIAISDVEQVIRIRTGEEQEKAV